MRGSVKASGPCAFWKVDELLAGQKAGELRHDVLLWILCNCVYVRYDIIKHGASDLFLRYVLKASGKWMESSTACTAPPWTSRILLHDLIKLLGRAHELHLEKTWTSFEDLNGHGIGWKINERPPFLYPRCVTCQSEFSTKICKEDYASHVLKKPREEGVALDIQEHWQQTVPPENIALSNRRWFAHMSHTNRDTHAHQMQPLPWSIGSVFFVLHLLRLLLECNMHQYFGISWL